MTLPPTSIQRDVGSGDVIDPLRSDASSSQLTLFIMLGATAIFLPLILGYRWPFDLGQLLQAGQPIPSNALHPGRQGVAEAAAELAEV